MVLSVIKLTNQVTIILEILNLEGHPNRSTGSRVTSILLNGWILPIGQSGEGSRWRVCYQLGLPRLVFKYTASCMRSQGRHIIYEAQGHILSHGLKVLHDQPSIILLLRKTSSKFYNQHQQDLKLSPQLPALHFLFLYLFFLFLQTNYFWRVFLNF